MSTARPFHCFIVTVNRTDANVHTVYSFPCSTSGESLYEVLGLKKDATPEEIKKAYRKVSGY